MSEQWSVEHVSPPGISFSGQPPLVPGGVRLVTGARLVCTHRRRESVSVDWRQFTVYRGAVHLGEVDFTACRTCRQAFLGQISFVEEEQRKGLGSAVIRHLRRYRRGYFWSTTGQSRSAAEFWRHIQQLYPGEYSTVDAGRLLCEHLKQA